MLDIIGEVESVMPFEEKMTWVTGIVGLLVPIVYFTSVLSQLGETPAADIAYQKPLLIAFGAYIVLTIAGAILAAIGTAIAAEVTGEGSVDDIDRKDERDIQINRRGEVVGHYVTSGFVLGVFALTMLEYEYFWIANALYAAFAVGAVVTSVVKIVSYRRGF
jgi:hypothetical protein